VFKRHLSLRGLGSNRKKNYQGYAGVGAIIEPKAIVNHDPFRYALFRASDCAMGNHDAMYSRVLATALTVATDHFHGVIYGPIKWKMTGKHSTIMLLLFLLLLSKLLTYSK
jgi:hypothetical protein